MPPDPGHPGYHLPADVQYDRATTASGGPTRGALALVAHWARVTGYGNAGIYNNRPVRGGNSLSVHAEGRAADLSVNANDPAQRAVGYRYITWLIQNAAALGVQQLIFNRWVWRPSSGWTPYKTGPGGSPHTDHIHVELNRAGADSPSPLWGATEADYANAVRAIGGDTSGGTYSVASSLGPNGNMATSGIQPGESIDDAARRMYGYLGWFLDHPEIGPVLKEAAEGGWDQNRLMGALYGTNWWKTTSEAARVWDALAASDPAEAEAQITGRIAEVRDLAKGIGIQLDDAALREIATGSIRFGIDVSSAQFRDTLAARIPAYGTGQPGFGEFGTFQATINEIERLARSEYMVGIAAADSYRLAQQVIAGDMTMDGIKAQFDSVAKGRFAHISEILDKGVTPGQYFAPYRAMVGDELEISADQVDLMSAEFNSITGVNTDKGMRPMTYSEAQRYIRHKPQWAKTAKARDLGASTARQLAESMGIAAF